MRKVRFANGEFYHIYNRGTDKRPVFLDRDDFDRFLQSMAEFNTKNPIGSLFENSFRDKSLLSSRTAKLVDIVCYCLNPNHYHIILRQRTENGISEFMKRLGGGYTQGFNFKYKRSGVLFQGKFKAAHIDSNEYLLHVSAYVNLNNLVHQIRGDEFRSSRHEYLNNIDKSLCTKDIVLKQFKNLIEYKDFSENSLKSILEKKAMQKELETMLLD